MKSILLVSLIFTGQTLINNYMCTAIIDSNAQVLYVNTLVHNYKVQVNHWVQDLPPRCSSTQVHNLATERKSDLVEKVRGSSPTQADFLSVTKLCVVADFLPSDSLLHCTL